MNGRSRPWQLWRRRLDTLQIAARLGVPESEAHRQLSAIREHMHFGEWRKYKRAPRGSTSTLRRIGCHDATL